MTDATVTILYVADPAGHECAARGCHVRLRSGTTFCKRHWRMIPQLVQKRIQRFWREWREHGSEVAPEQWARAVGEAVDAITAVEPATSG